MGDEPADDRTGGDSVRVDVLGPLRLFVGDQPVDVRGPKRRAVLAMLALAEGRAVTVDALVDAVWPVEPTGHGPLHSHVHRIRGHLGRAGGRLQRLDGAYRLQLAADELDAARARSLYAQARDRRRDDPAGAYELLGAARGLFRGLVLAEFAEVTALATAAVGLEQLRREVIDQLIECALEARRVDDVVGLAAQAAAAEPLREPAVLLHMRALAASGQAPQALDAGRRFRRRLADEAGLDPSPALGELERAIAGGTVTIQRGTPEHTFTPVTVGGPPGFRPAVPTRPVTPLVGREGHVAALHRLLRSERLVTLVGPGGVGKTRVALEVAHRARPAAVLPLAAVTDPAAIGHALASVMELRVVHGDVLAACTAVLASGPFLLVVDNCEHLLAAARDLVAALLDGCPELTVLATSRAPLGLSGECLSRLAPLPLPADGDDPALQHVPSVAVFLDRATRIRPGFAPDPDELRLIAHTVRRLDGMPLAIELAAGRLSTMSVAELARRLDRSLDLLGSAQPSIDARHQTLRATMEWSYRLLPERARRLLRQLSAFADGVDLDSAEQIAAELGVFGDPSSLLSQLVDASMVDAVVGDPTRYRMLETLRAFALDKLSAEGETEAAWDRVLRWALRLAAQIDAAVQGDGEPEADATLRRELPNLRAAWRLARDRGRLDEAVLLATRLYEISVWRDLPDLRHWAAELAGDPALATHPQAALVLGAAARAAYMRGDYREAGRLARAGLELATDTQGRWQCLRALALADLSRGAFRDVVKHERDAAALATRPNGGFGIAALGATYAGDLGQARALHEQLAAQATSPTLRAFAAYVAGEIDRAAGEPGRSERHYQDAIELARGCGATFIVAVASVGRVTVCGEAGDADAALRGYREVIDYFARTGNWTHLWTAIRNLANLLRRLGDHEPAAQLDAAADRAPDAPATRPDSEHPAAASRTGPADRVHALALARQAIDRHLRESHAAQRDAHSASARPRPDLDPPRLWSDPGRTRPVS